MKRDEDEVIKGESSVRTTWFILIAIYILFLLWLEPLIDFLMSYFPPDKDFAAIDVFNKQKTYIAVVAFALARMFPICLCLYLGYRSMLTGQFPPKNMRMPITVHVLKGQKSRMLSMLVIVLASILLFKEIILVVNTPLVM